MTSLLALKDQIVKIYLRFEAYINPVLKFFLMLVTLIVLNNNIGYMTKLKNPAIVLIVALLCSFLPLNLMVLFAALFILLHMYALSLACLIVVGLIMLIMFVIYFRFTPKDAVGTLLTPILFTMKIPFVMPVSMGLLGSIASCVSVSLGAVMYYVLHFIKKNSDALLQTGLDVENMIASFRTIIDGIIGNDTMKVMAVTFAVTTLVVYLIRRMPINYSWQIAIGVGAILQIVIALIASAALDADVSAGGAILGTILAVVIAFVIQFFTFNVDYSRTETVQFEDDEYYYYVKAVPKLYLEAKKVKVKRINPDQRPVPRNPRMPAAPDMRRDF